MSISKSNSTVRLQYPMIYCCQFEIQMLSSRNHRAALMHWNMTRASSILQGYLTQHVIALLTVSPQQFVIVQMLLYGMV